MRKCDRFNLVIRSTIRVGRERWAVACVYVAQLPYPQMTLQKERQQVLDSSCIYLQKNIVSFVYLAFLVYKAAVS